MYSIDYMLLIHVLIVTGFILFYFIPPVYRSSQGIVRDMRTGKGNNNNNMII